MTLVPTAPGEEPIGTDRVSGDASLPSQPVGEPESEERYSGNPAEDEKSEPLPDRYVAQTTESGQAVLSCRETPNIMVQVERGCPSLLRMLGRWLRDRSSWMALLKARLFWMPKNTSTISIITRAVSGPSRCQAVSRRI